MALAFADASTDQVDHLSDTSLDDLTTISILFWINAADVANAFRDCLIKGANLQIFRRGVDGTRVGFLHNSSAAPDNPLVDIATGNMTAGWNFCAFTMNFTVSVAAYWGNLTTAASDKSSGANIGTGTLSSDAGASLHVGASSAGANSAAPWTWAWLGIWNRVLTLNEIIQQQYRRFPTNGCVLFSEYGFGGATTQIDWSGRGNNGTVTGATAANHGPLAPSWYHRPFEVNIPTAVVYPKRSQFLHWFPPVTK